MGCVDWVCDAHGTHGEFLSHCDGSPSSACHAANGLSTASSKAKASTHPRLMYLGYHHFPFIHHMQHIRQSPQQLPLCVHNVALPSLVYAQSCTARVPSVSSLHCYITTPTNNWPASTLLITQG
ncbi:hypothetical protein HaLaN_16087, partial [Haematococcus lacustris]